MNLNEHPSWEARLDRMLKDLPEIPAPEDLVARTMTSLQRRQKQAWFHQPWTQWPMWLRALSLASALVCFGAICAIKWEFAHTLLGQEWSQRFSGQISSWNVTLGALDTLGRAAMAVAHHMNTWLAIVCLFAATTAYLACVGIGTAAVRLAFSRR